MPSILIFLISTLIQANSLDIFISDSHLQSCQLEEKDCFGERSRPFSDLSDGLIFIEMLSNDGKLQLTSEVKIFLNANNKETPYLIKKNIEDPFQQLPGRFDFFFKILLLFF